MLIDGPIEAFGKGRELRPGMRLRRCSSTAPLKQPDTSPMRHATWLDSVDAHRRPH